MSRELIKQAIAGLTVTHEAIIEKLARIADQDLDRKVTWGGREVEVRFLLLQMGNHDRQHAIQVAKSLQWLRQQLSEAEMTVAKAQQARGELLGLLAAVNDEDLDRVPKEGEWSIRKTLEHVLEVQKRYYANVEKALEG